MNIAGIEYTLRNCYKLKHSTPVDLNAFDITRANN